MTFFWLMAIPPYQDLCTHDIIESSNLCQIELSVISCNNIMQIFVITKNDITSLNVIQYYVIIIS